MLDQFGSLAAVLAASPDAIERLTGGARVAWFLQTVRQAQLHALRTPLAERPVMSSPGAVADFAVLRLAHERRECLWVLFLDAGNRLLRDELTATGSIHNVALPVREILRRALEIGATALILLHNHPSGDPRPSGADRDATLRLASAARPLDILIHDHLIVTAGGIISLRAEGLL